MSRTVVGVFSTRDQAYEAIRELKERDFSEEQISLVARDEEKQDSGNEEMSFSNQNLSDGTATGGAIGGLTGLLAGAGALLIPGIGPIIAAGPLAGALTGLVTGGIAGGLIDYGIPEKEGRRYQEEVSQGKLLVAVKVDDKNMSSHAVSIFRENGADDVRTYEK